ncbi:hypothetical protein PsalN5692_03731 (plasmid) [Piscirickettsia salmonis]|nr:hypothetical protein PsalN5692_03731 [Piscirickettsia salmonis]
MIVKIILAVLALFAFLYFFINDINFLFSSIGKLIFSAREIWCLYKHIGVEKIFVILMSPIVSFSIPILFSNSSYNNKLDSLTKVRFNVKKIRMKIWSGLLILTTTFSLFTYYALWKHLLPDENICSHVITADITKVSMVYMLIAVNVLSVFFSYFMLSNWLFYKKYKSNDN